ncbi:MAG: NAD(P)-binding oxidoreductase, partial [Rubrobacteraceae bacterium]
SQLASAGAAVRALVRDPAAADMPEGVEAVVGDLSKPNALEDALTGVEAVCLVRPFLTTEAAPAGVEAIAGHSRRVVYVSSAGVRDGARRQADPINQFHSEIELLIEGSGLQWTLLRSGGLG